MKTIIKTSILSVLVAVLLALWIPNFIVGSTTSANANLKESTIGGVEVGSLRGGKLVSVLEDAVEQWYTQPLVISSDGCSIEIDRTMFEFDIEATVKQYEKNYTKKWYELWGNDRQVHLPLLIQTSDIVKNEISNITSWNTEDTYAKVVLNAAYLKNDVIEAVVNDVSVLETERIFLSMDVMPDKATAINELISSINETIINPQTTFSMIETLGDAINLTNNEAVNFVASTIYKAALNINGEIIERHAQNKIPVYTKPGLEAQVDASLNQDLKFVNTWTTPVIIKLSMSDGKLMTEVYTSFKDVKVSVSVLQDEMIEPRTITRFTEELSIGQTEQLQKGEQGLRVSVYRTVDGAEKLVSRDYYPPVNHVLLKSSKQPQVQSFENPDALVHLNDDFLADVNLPGSSSILITDGSEMFDSQESLPPGSYYDKGGNLITPTGGGE